MRVGTNDLRIYGRRRTAVGSTALLLFLTLIVAADALAFRIGGVGNTLTGIGKVSERLVGAGAEEAMLSFEFGRRGGGVLQALERIAARKDMKAALKLGKGALAGAKAVGEGSDWGTVVDVAVAPIGLKQTYDWKLSAQQLEQRGLLQETDATLRTGFIGSDPDVASKQSEFQQWLGDELYKYEEGQGSGPVDEDEIRKRSIAELRSFMDERTSNVSEVQSRRQQLDREVMTSKHDAIRDLMRESQRELSRRAP